MRKFTVFARGLRLAALFLAAGVLCARPQEGQLPDSSKGAFPEAAAPAVFQALDVALNVYDVSYGFNGGWAASDGLLDRIVELKYNGDVIRSVSLNLLVTNLYSAADKNYFNALDATGAPRVGFEWRGRVSGTLLRPGALTQGGDLAVRADDTGFSLSPSLSSGQFFNKDYIYSSLSVTLSGARRTALGPDGKFYVGSGTGLTTVDDLQNVQVIKGYSADVRALTGCGGGLWTGTPNSLDWITVSDGQASVTRFTTSTAINWVDCGGNGSAVAVGANRSLYYVNPSQSVFRGFSVPGSGNLVKVSLGWSTTPKGFLLDVTGNQGSLGSFTLSESYSPERNTAASRLPRLEPRLLF